MSHNGLICFPIGVLIILGGVYILTLRNFASLKYEFFDEDIETIEPIPMHQSQQKIPNHLDTGYARM